MIHSPPPKSLPSIMSQATLDSRLARLPRFGEHTLRTLQVTLVTQAMGQSIDAEDSESLQRMVVEMRTSMKVAMSVYNAIKHQKEDKSKFLAARNTSVPKNTEVMDILPL